MTKVIVPFVATNQVLINAVCPIDTTQLVARMECDFYDYHCKTCGAVYLYGDKNSASLRRQAEGYLARKKEELVEERAKI